MPFRLEVVTAERSVFSDDVDSVVAPGVEGELGILPKHAPLLTVLDFGDLRVKQGQLEFDIAVGGGFLEVRRDKVVVLADMAERAEDIDVTRAEEARKRAHEALQAGPMSAAEEARARASLQRALVRIRISERRRRRL